MVAKNEKGEATSQTVEVTELPPEEKPKGEKPKLTKLTNIVSCVLLCIFEKIRNTLDFRQRRRANRPTLFVPLKPSIKRSTLLGTKTMLSLTNLAI